MHTQNDFTNFLRILFFFLGDGLRVVDFETKGLLVDQTIEKVSFCAPDHNYDRGFSYICRDGTTRRWMCHGFMAIKETVNTNTVNIFLFMGKISILWTRDFRHIFFF